MQHEQSQHQHGHSVEVAGHDLVYSQVHLEDFTPTGAQIAAAAGFKPDQFPVILQIFESGAQEDIRPDETATLSSGINRFIVVESDRKYLLTVDGVRYEWPCKHISGHTVRKLADVGPGKRLLLEYEDKPDQDIEDTQLINLDANGIEHFITRKAIWKLNIQGEIYEFDKPIVTVREAIVAAGLNANYSWQIFLMVRDEPKQPLDIDDNINLRLVGIEKLRLTQKDVNNGEVAAQPLHRDFKLLHRDEQYLDTVGHRWETRNTNEGGRWLVIHDYTLPDGYSEKNVKLALSIPPTYPNTMLDMFYIYPAIRLANGAEIAQTHIPGHIDGIIFQGWSRHRSWDPVSDNVVTQLAMADGCLLKEVGL